MTNSKTDLGTDLGMRRTIPAFTHQDGTRRGPFTRFTVLRDPDHEGRYGVYERNPAAPLEIDLWLENMPFDEAVREAQRLDQERTGA